MSQIYQKADPSFFSDMSTSKSFITYPTYPCSQFNKSISDTPNNDHEFKSDDESSNENSLPEEMDAVKRFCNISNTIESDGNKQKLVNKDNIVNTLLNVDNCVDVVEKKSETHNEDTCVENDGISSVNNSDESNSVNNLCEDSCSEPKIGAEKSELRLDSTTADSSKACKTASEIPDSLPSSISDHQSCEKSSGLDNDTQDCDSSTTLGEDVQDPTSCTKLECEGSISDSSSSTSPEKRTPGSQGRSERPVRLRPPSLKLIEAAGGATSAKDYCGKSKLIRSPVSIFEISTHCDL